ncbi:peptidase T [Hutsoniella sourekii]|uniref:peptidase T n=1 Tax=Hutsoniella sourekii TaxID=87650 RepID=UPI0004855C80|nr:peptidase T [Hutsoniella sourekii]
MFNQLQDRFIEYAKINTRSDASSQSIPSTERQLDLSRLLVEELEKIGMEEVALNTDNGFVTATLPANTPDDQSVATIGFIAHVDTADFNSENVNPQIINNYAGQDIDLDGEGAYVMKVSDFPQLADYQGQTLITTDGTTLLGADDKAGIAEIVTAMDYLIQHPEIQHGKIRVAFGPDEEIGRGADHFDVEGFACDFAYTMDGGPVGELQYESFNACEAKIEIQGVSVHPGTAKGQMVNAISLANQILSSLPSEQVPELTDGRDGFYHVYEIKGTVEEAELILIIRDFDRQTFQEMKEKLVAICQEINEKYLYDPVEISLLDQYYNMAEIIEQDMTPIELAKAAMESLDIEPVIAGIRGGTDGSKLSFMGLPTPNIFAGGENMHGRYEFVAVESMVKACQVIVKIAELNAK